MKKMQLTLFVFSVSVFLLIPVFSFGQDILQRAGAWQYGTSDAIFVDTANHVGYLGSGGAVLILDVKNPANPVLLSNDLRTAGFVEDIWYNSTDHNLYLACGRGGMEVWNVSDNANPIHLSTTPIIYGGVEAPVHHLEIYQNIAALECEWGYVHTVDISDPYNPVQVSYNGQMGNPAHDITVDEGGYIHSTGQQYYVRLAIGPDGSLSNAGQIYLYSAGSVFGNLSEVYISYGGYMNIYSLSGGGLLSSTEVSITDIFVRQDTAFIINSDGFEIWNCTNISNPVLVGSVNFSSGNEIFLDGHKAYVSARQVGLMVIDFSNPANPHLIGQYPGNGWTPDLDMSGTVACVAQDLAMYTVDMTNPEGNGPTALGMIESNGQANSVAITGNIACLADWTGGLRIIDISDPANPLELSTVPIHAWKVAASDNYVYVTDVVINVTDTLKIYDISNPEIPQMTGKYTLPELTWDLEYSGGYVYASNYNSGVNVIDVSNPTNPTLASTINLPVALDVAIDGDYAYVSSQDWSGGLVSVDISDPSNPQVLQIYNPSGWFHPGHVAAFGGYAYASELFGDMRVFDVNNPANMLELETHNLPGDILNMMPFNNYVYISNGETGVQIWKNTAITGVQLDLKVFLEGPFNGSQMTAQLYNSSEFPLPQPYNVSPWNYPGTEYLTAIPNENVVDWILLEFRDAPDPASATTSTTVERMAALLMKDGSVRSLDGLSNPETFLTVANNLFVVIRHRNHLAVMSANPMIMTGDVYTYDFTTGFDKVYGGLDGYKQLNSGIFGMAGGDCNGDGLIDESDKAAWAENAGKNGYQLTDLSLDIQVDNSDKNDIWLINSNLTSQVPE